MLDPLGLVYLVRELGDDDPVALAPPVLDLGDTPDDDPALPGIIGVLDPLDRP